MIYKWGYHDKINSIKRVDIDESVKNYHGLTSTAYMFYYMMNAENITGEEYLNVSNVTDMSNMFYSYGLNSTKLDKVPDVSNWDTTSVTNMEKFFSHYGESSTAFNFALNLSSWSVAKINSYSEIFNDAGKSTSTWSVTIPKKTGNKDNDVSHWYVGDGSKYIQPYNSRLFTVAGQ